MTKKNTVFIAEVSKANDYGIDTVLNIAAFDSMEKAKSFMVEKGLEMWSPDTEFGWVSMTSFDITGKISVLTVN
jgi:hypothetical protein